MRKKKPIQPVPNLPHAAGSCVKLNKIIPDRISDELWDKTIGMLNANPEKYSQNYKTCVIHAVDSCSRGYITPAELYAAMGADYFPEYLTVRPSLYAHML